MARVLFVDVLRLLALLQMVNGHTLDAVLAESERMGPGFERYRFVRGLVSVAFLVVAGISFYLTTVARFERHRADPQAVRRRLWRASQIVLVGYALQLRWPGVYFGATTSGAALSSLFRCEVLQCIGLSLIGLELLTLASRRAFHVVVGSGLLAILMFGLAPLGELMSASEHVRPWFALVGHGQRSQFPLLPWAGYVFAGVVIGAVALPESGRTPLSRRVLGLSAVALVAGGVSHGLKLAPAIQDLTVRASSNPWFIIQKLAVIALVLALLAVFTHRLRALPPMLTILGSETLAIFVFHLQVLFGGNWALAHTLGRTLSLQEGLFVSLFNIVLSVAFGLGWHELKRRQVLRALLSRADGAPAVET